MSRRMQVHGVRRRAAATLVLSVSLSVCAAVAAAGHVGPAAAAAPGSVPTAAGETDLYLVTLTGPGTARTGTVLPGQFLATWMVSAQNQVLESVGADEPTYRWTTALSGFAVELTSDQAGVLADDPRVALVEPNRMLELARTATPAAALSAAPALSAPAAPAATATPAASSTGGGAGTVIGFVDSGITPEGPVFAAVPNLGPAPERFTGECRTGPDWPTSACNDKVVGAQWFVDGFGADRVRDASSLSTRDDDGHGTAVASVAAGNDGLVARVPGQPGQRLGRFSGVAPQARVAAYKACWTAPDPDDDGCATADVVSAIDRATADGVDVLNLSIAGETTPAPAKDTVQRALLGAAEADIVVVGAAGNGPGDIAYAAPWITTVGAVTGDVRRGLVVRKGAPALPGTMVSDQPVGPARLVRGADVAALGTAPRDARLCLPGSLDAGAVAHRVVLCDRGGVGRTDKSLAVQQADGVGMVLANVVSGSRDPDLHVVPTVHVDAPQGRDLERWLDRHPRGRVTLKSLGVVRTAPRPAGWSRVGAVVQANGLANELVTPELLAVGGGVLAAGRPDSADSADRGGSRWQLVSGTSVAAAQVSGAAAVIRGSRPWAAPRVRSALVSTAAPVTGSSNGAGLLRLVAALQSARGLVVDAADYRAWMDTNGG